MEELLGLLISMYVPGPGAIPLTFLLQDLSSLQLKGTLIYIDYSIKILLLTSFSFFLLACVAYWPGGGLSRWVYWVKGAFSSCFQKSPRSVVLMKGLVAFI